jgi:hypothetical protein
VKPRAKAYAGPDLFESYVPTPRQALFHRIPRWPGFDKVIKGAIGGLGGGKSFACQQELLEIAMKTPDGKSVAMRESLPKAEGTLVDEIQKIGGPLLQWSSTKLSHFLPNGHQLLYLPADKWDRLGSEQFVAGYMQETQEIDYRIWSVLSERLRHPKGVIDGIPYYRLLFDSRPVETRHWIKEKFIDVAWNVDDGPKMRPHAKKPFYVYVKFQSFDNEAHLRENYISELLEEHKDEPGWIQMMVYGDVGYSLEGVPVYGETYRPEVHDAQIQEDPRLPILRTWDFGFRSPAILWCQWTRDGRLLVLREFCPKRIERDRFVDEVLAIQQTEFPDRDPSQYRDFGDIAGAQITWAGITDIEYIESRLGTVFEGLVKESIEDGIECVRFLMRKPAPYGREFRTCLMIDTSCVMLREALRAMYAYPEKGTHKPPAKGNGYDDVCDALRFLAQALVSAGQGEIPGLERWGTRPEDDDEPYAVYGITRRGKKR